MSISELLNKLSSNPDEVDFDDVIAVIDSVYEFSPCRFSNGGMVNEQGQNNGSCRIFAFAQLHNLSEQQTLHCFGDYYRSDVLGNPEGNDHQNIRNFIKTGWSGIEFDATTLTEKRNHD